VGSDLRRFAFVRSPSKEKLFEDDKAIKEGYDKEIEELVKKEVMDAKRCSFWAIRSGRCTTIVTTNMPWNAVL
jgi:hypothetical protein